MKHKVLHRFWMWLKWGSHNRINRFQFDQAARGILKTPVVRGEDDGCVIISLVSHCDVWMYLVSAKSFAYFFKRGRFVVINDGSLTKKDIKILMSQIINVEIKAVSDVQNDKCPKGGCWERLLCVADYINDHYVVVLDADMVAQSGMEEVKECVDQNRSFIMGLKDGQEIEPMKDVWQQEVDTHGQQALNGHYGIQQVFDTNMDRISGFHDLKYLKGSGGFNGFAKGSFSRDDVERFSEDMSGIFDERWCEWGTEQIAVCFLIANSPLACILEHSKYAIYYPHLPVNYQNCSVVHFVGMCRFKNGFYKDVAKKTICELRG